MLRKLRLRQKIGFLMKKTCIMKMIVATTSKISDSNFQLPGYYSFHLVRETIGGKALYFFCKKLIHTNSEKASQ